jgi:hypothetical protein
VPFESIRSRLLLDLEKFLPNSLLITGIHDSDDDEYQ